MYRTVYSSGTHPPFVLYYPFPMAPKAAKSKEAPAERPVLGRFSSHLKIGIVGLPNVGKSTLFNTLTKMAIPAENFPFCTIEPNEARVNVPDERFDWLCQFKPKSEVSAFLEIHDIAGLVRGAHQGQGLGNSFLSHIRAVDGIFHVLRAFEDPDIIHVDDTVDPVRDLEIISEELRLKDIEFMERKIEDVEKSMKRSNDKQLKIELECCQKVKALLEEGKDVRFGDWKAADIEILNSFQLLTAKAVVYLVNMTERDYQRKKNKFLPKIHAWSRLTQWLPLKGPSFQQLFTANGTQGQLTVQEHGGEQIIPFSGALERNLADMPPDEVAKYCEENKIQSALPKIIKTGFAAINLIYFFTVGPEEVKCWQIRRHTKAPQAAGAIHTDFERGFICAEVMKFDDLKELGSEGAVKEYCSFMFEFDLKCSDKIRPSIKNVAPILVPEEGERTTSFNVIVAMVSTRSMTRENDSWVQEREKMRQERENIRQEREELRLRLELNEIRSKNTKEMIAAIATKLGISKGVTSVGDDSENEGEKLERYFTLKAILEKERMQATMVALEGKALSWGIFLNELKEEIRVEVMLYEFETLPEVLYATVGGDPGLLSVWVEKGGLGAGIKMAAGKYKQEGKTYVVQDGDIIFFKFNVSGGGKK
ncbi:hypothetical protein Lal_00043977 [Lupinus albus]|nr:hypothetical protein Lal_00043977 [Lupinus albus]